MIDDTNSIISYNRHHTREIHATIKSLSLERRQRLLDEIQLQKATSLLMNKSYNHTDCERIEKLLNGKKP